ncbi:MAG: hypothetical protein R3A44_05985 [Caldilineaceae bacterium]
MLKYRKNNSYFSNEQVLYWLSWQAHQNSIHRQSIFYLETMQPSFLNVNFMSLHRIVYALLVGIVAGVLFGIIVGISNGLFNAIGGGLKEWLAAGVEIGKTDWWEWRNWKAHFTVMFVPFALIFGTIFTTSTSMPAPDLTDSYFKRQMYLTLAGSVGGGIAGVINNAIFYHNSYTIVAALLLGLIHGLLASSILTIGKIERLARKPDWSQLGSGLSKSFVIGAIFSLFVWWVYGLMTSHSDAILASMNVFGMCLLFGILPALTSNVYEIGRISKPNYVVQSIKSFVFLGSIFSLIGAVWLGFNHSIAYGLVNEYGFIWMIIFLCLDVLRWSANALWVGIAVALLYGGGALIQHIILRMMLYLQGSIPRPGMHTRFLEYAVNLNFLRKRGGGYDFVHSMLQDHFRELTTFPLKKG